MFQGLEDLYLSQCRHRHALFFVVHKDPLQSYDLSARLLNSLVHLATRTKGDFKTFKYGSKEKDDKPESSFPQLGCNIIVRLQSASDEFMSVSLYLLLLSPSCTSITTPSWFFADLSSRFALKPVKHNVLHIDFFSNKRILDFLLERKRDLPWRWRFRR